MAQGQAAPDVLELFAALQAQVGAAPRGVGRPAWGGRNGAGRHPRASEEGNVNGNGWEGVEGQPIAAQNNEE